MACFNPIRAWRGRMKEDGKREVLFRRPPAPFSDSVLDLPCGKCIGCAMDHARQWSIRCSHEAKLWPENTFLTLTYDDDHLPKDGSLSKSDFQLFMKRLRDKLSPRIIRFFGCGEYGTEGKRPHYHILIFNANVSTEQVSQCWDKGFNVCGSVTPQSVSYVSGYCLKKVSGDTNYSRESGEELAPEFRLMSRNPGIGHGWFSKFKSDAYPSDFLIRDGMRVSVPRYYDKLLEKHSPEEYVWVKRKREDAPRVLVPDVNSSGANILVDNGSMERLNVREKIALARKSRLNRPMEVGQ